MGVQMMGQTTFYNIQKVYLHLAIEEVYSEKRTELLARVYLEQEDGKRLHLTGDGRCDTPGFSAKYCHYTFMLDDTKEILHAELVQVTEATSSVTMEPLAFKTGMTELMDQGLDVEALKCWWKSITHHVCNEHEWTDENGEQHRCDHAPLTAQEQKKRMWMKKDSMAFQDLSSLVLDKRLLRDMEKMALFKHTGPLEVFHSALLKYLPKRQAFSFQGMRERCHLAILEHNENIVKRKQDTTKTGQARFNQVFCKRSKQWVLKKIFIPHTTQFIDTLIKRVMDKRRSPNIQFTMPTSSLSLPQPALPPNIAPVPKPSKEAATTSFQSRF
ncbi:unnamed protein product [Leuciscus chuanchicus]